MIKYKDEKHIIGELKVLETTPNAHFFYIEIKMMREGINQNDWDYRNLKEYFSTFLGQPILCAYVGNKIGDGHNMREKTDKSGEKYQSFTDATAERIVGEISEDINDLTLREEDGNTWLYAKGKLWKFYTHELVEQIVRTGRMSVSVETLVADSHFAENGKTEVFTRWEGIGVTILGKDVAPAIPSAQIKALSTGQMFKELKLKAASLEKELLKKTNKGEKLMSKRAIAELQTLFDNHTVLAASEDNTKICLLSNDGRTYTATSDVVDGSVEVNAKRITATNAKVIFRFNDDEEIQVDATEMTDALSARLMKETEKAEKAEERAEKAEKEAEDMKDKENKRRSHAAKEAAKAKLDEINNIRDEKIDEKSCEDIYNRCEAGDYNEIADNEGMWIGDKSAAADVAAKCMEEILENEKETKAKQQKMMSWDIGIQNHAKQQGGLEATISKLTQRKDK